MMIYGQRGDLIGFIRGAARFAGNVIGGPAGMGLRAIGGSGAPRVLPGGAAPSFSLSQAPQLGGGPGTSLVRPGGGPVTGRISPLGTVGTCPTEIVYTKSGHARRYRLKKGGGCTWHKRPTMNPMNPHAAGRAITRIKAARTLLHRIESGLPKRHASGGKKSCGCGRR